jgi:hypothetical protein
MFSFLLVFVFPIHVGVFTKMTIIFGWPFLIKTGSNEESLGVFTYKWSFKAETLLYRVLRSWSGLLIWKWSLKVLLWSFVPWDHFVSVRRILEFPNYVSYTSLSLSCRWTWQELSTMQYSLSHFISSVQLLYPTWVHRFLLWVLKKRISCLVLRLEWVDVHICWQNSMAEGREERESKREWERASQGASS